MTAPANTHAGDRIVVAGYPKSGNTWVTRLVAHAVGCPAAGFWGEPDNPEIAMEGSGRASPFEVFKAHHPWSDLRPVLAPERLVVVVRDPRAVAASGAAYFQRPPRTDAESRLVRSGVAGRAWNKLVLNPPWRRADRMIEWMEVGTPELRWLETPWDEHVDPYLESGAVVVRYEDLRTDPLAECGRILSHLGINRPTAAVEEAIKAQSFEARKRAFRQDAEDGKADFLRRGEAEAWRRELSPRQATRIERAFAHTMERLGYR